MFFFKCTVCALSCVCAYECGGLCLFVCLCVSVLVLQVYNVNPVPSQVGNGKSVYFSVE